MKISHPKSIFSSRNNLAPKRPNANNSKNKKDTSAPAPCTPVRRPLLSSSSSASASTSTSKAQPTNVREVRKDDTSPRLNSARISDANGNAPESLEDGLAICLFGYSVQAQSHPIQTTAAGTRNGSACSSIAETPTNSNEQKIKSDPTKIETPPNAQRFTFNMFDASYEEEIRQQAVMAEVLPDAEMWAKWEKTEAPLRQGRGWYPRLDRHFLELLVTSEIHALSHPLQSTQAGTADRIHRHATRVRRVACERIGAERLNAYCERVKEAFEAYMMGGWAQTQAVAQPQTQIQTQAQQGTSSSESADGPGDEAEHEASKQDARAEATDDEEDSVDGLASLADEIQTIEDRGRTLKREGNLHQAEKGPSPPHPATIHFAIGSKPSAGSTAKSTETQSSIATQGQTLIPSQESTTGQPGRKDVQEKADPFGDDSSSGDDDPLSDLDLNELPLNDLTEPSESGRVSTSQSDYHRGRASASTSARATRGSSMDIDVDESEPGSGKRIERFSSRSSDNDMDVDLSEDMTYSTLVRHGRPTSARPVSQSTNLSNLL
ncbi:hypothetical protein IAU59_007138 [Kwoniella sp. CBS 9459]